MKAEQEEKREPILVPVRREKQVSDKDFKDIPPGSTETEVWEMPRRWYVY